MTYSHVLHFNFLSASYIEALSHPMCIIPFLYSLLLFLKSGVWGKGIFAFRQHPTIAGLLDRRKSCFLRMCGQNKSEGGKAQWVGRWVKREQQATLGVRLQT